METPCKFIIAKLSIRKLGSSLTRTFYISANRADGSMHINLRGVSTTRENEKALKQELNRLIITSIAELIRHKM